MNYYTQSEGDLFYKLYWLLVNRIKDEEMGLCAWLYHIKRRENKMKTMYTIQQLELTKFVI